MKRYVIAAFLLAGSAGASFAQAAAPADFETYVVDNADSCPAGTYASVPSYEWQDGRFVRNGWLCESLYKSGD